MGLLGPGKAERQEQARRKREYEENVEARFRLLEKQLAAVAGRCLHQYPHGSTCWCYVCDQPFRLTVDGKTPK